MLNVLKFIIDNNILQFDNFVTVYYIRYLEPIMGLLWHVYS